MEDLATDIFNILKGANFKLKLFNSEGVKTLNPEEANRFYAYDQDLMITIRYDDGKLHVVLQAGEDFQIQSHKDLLNAIKTLAHKNMGSYDIRKFNKHITPKDFSHQSVTESKNFSKAFGTIKTSYINFPQGKLIIKHSKQVDEEVRGSRSRNIHSIFIENSLGERFRFPFASVSAARVMARHISEGGTPYDTIGERIAQSCEDMLVLKKFLNHVKKKGLVTDENLEYVNAAKDKLSELRSDIKRATSTRGYINFIEKYNNNKETVEKTVDVTEKFLYNTLQSEELERAVKLVGEKVTETREKQAMHLEYIEKLGKLITDKVDLKMNLNPADPEHPDNENPVKYSGSEGPMARLSAMLSLFAMRTKNDEASNLFSELTSHIFKMDPKSVEFVAKVVDYIERTHTNKTESVEETGAIPLDEGVMVTLRKKIS